MEFRIIIIHRSEIIRQGLSSILKNSFDQDCVLLDSVDELKNYNSISKTRIVLLIDSQIDEDDVSKRIESLDNSNSIKIVLIRALDEIKECKENCDCCFYINDSKARILDLLNTYIIEETRYSEKKSSTWLTDREIEVIKLIALGKTNKEMAGDLFISKHTVISHRKNITEKLGIKSISGLTVYAILNNLIDTNSIDIESLI